MPWRKGAECLERLLKGREDRIMRVHIGREENALREVSPMAVVEAICIVTLSIIELTFVNIWKQDVESRLTSLA